MATSINAARKMNPSRLGNAVAAVDPAVSKLNGVRAKLAKDSRNSPAVAKEFCEFPQGNLPVSEQTLKENGVTVEITNPHSSGGIIIRAEVKSPVTTRVIDYNIGNDSMEDDGMFSDETTEGFYETLRRAIWQAC